MYTVLQLEQDLGCMVRGKEMASVLSEITIGWVRTETKQTHRSREKILSNGGKSNERNRPKARGIRTGALLADGTTITNSPTFSAKEVRLFPP